MKCKRTCGSFGTIRNVTLRKCDIRVLGTRNNVSRQSKILGVTYGTTMMQTMKHSWTGTINTVRALARTTYTRNLCFAQRIRYVITCLMAKIWYTAQIVPITNAQVQQLTTICNWYLWQGAIFRVPQSTLRRPKEEGGWNFPCIRAKCRTLIYNRTHLLGRRDGAAMAELMYIWDITPKPANPPHAIRIPPKLVHVK